MGDAATSKLNDALPLPGGPDVPGAPGSGSGCQSSAPLIVAEGIAMFGTW